MLIGPRYVNSSSLSQLIHSTGMFFSLLTVFPLLCGALSSSQLSHSSRSLTASERGHENFGPGNFANKLENRYLLNITCDPILPKPGVFEVHSTGYSRLPISNKEQVSWFLKPTHTPTFKGTNMTVVAVEMRDSGHCDTADLVHEHKKIGPNSILLFVSNTGCTPLQVIKAGQKLSTSSSYFMFYHLSYDYTSAFLPQIPNDPSIFVFIYEDKTSVERLRNVLENRTCFLNAQFVHSGMDGLINKTSVLFVSISFIFLMLISLAWLVFYYIQRFRYIHAKERLSRRLLNAAKKALANIPVRPLKSFDKDLPWQLDQCSVCIEPFKVCENVRVLPCRHYFHKSCIDPWLLEQRTCPLCKLDILKAYGLQVRGHRGSLASLDQATMSMSPEPRRPHVVLVCSATETSQPSEPSDEGPIQVTLEPPEVQYHHRHEVRLERAPSPVSSEEECARPLVYSTCHF